MFSCHYSDCMSREMYSHTGCNCFQAEVMESGGEREAVGRPRTAPTFILQSSSPPAGGGGDIGGGEGVDGGGDGGQSD